MKTVFLGIGTNKGNRERNISIALKLLSGNKRITIVKVSNMLKNSPQEGIKSGYFLNGAIKIKTTMAPLELLTFCKKIEKTLGRIISRRTKKKQSRTIDLDILFYGHETIKTRSLLIPHPMLHKRYFVLIPLLEIEPNHTHPTLNKTIKELYLETPKTSKYA